MYCDLDLIYSGIKEYFIYYKILQFDFELKKAYKSPYRQDTKPSFAIYRSDKEGFEFFWKDFGDNKKGNIIDLYMLCYNKNKSDSIEAILEADYSNISEFIVKDNITNIRIASRKFTEEELKYWSDINVEPHLLKLFNVSAFDNFYVNINQYMPFYYKEMSFAYKYNNRYQLYFPTNEKKKFVNEWDNTMIIGEGVIGNLDLFSSTLIITKSYKDMLCLISMGYASLAVRSENIFCDFSKFNSKFKNILILFDNDGKHIGNKYPYPLLQLKSAKDISDLIRQEGIDKACSELKSIIYEYI